MLWYDKIFSNYGIVLMFLLQAILFIVPFSNSNKFCKKAFIILLNGGTANFFIRRRNKVIEN